ncbi:LysR substrate-binding domain-containing protein, partial [Streptomyces sp. CC77]|uniref:LysR substrate-binding domain-containing protein n=1 Tax=Streptomyces sp. CC77 TaxID=1906739 RepID=UPI0009A0EDF5
MTGTDAPSSFRLAYVPGVMPAKWVRIWQERLPDVPLELVPVSAADAVGVLRDHTCDAGLVRLPVDRAVLSAIPLYTETTVVVVPKDHVVAAADEVSAEDLADEIVFHPLDDTLDWERPPGRPAFERPATTADAIELVAAGVGVLIVPMSLARLHHRRDLTYRPVTGVPQSQVALSWPEARTTDLVDDFIGIVRGRTVNSTRGRRAAEPAGGRSGGEKSAGRASGQRSPGSGGTGRAAGGAQPKGGARRRGGSGGQAGRGAARPAGGVAAVLVAALREERLQFGRA